MRARWRRLPAVLVAWWAAGPGVAAGQTVGEVVERARESVMLLRVYDAAGQEVAGGTGFLVRDGIVVTNRHVATAGWRIEAVLDDERSVDVLGVIASSARDDLALLRVPSVGVEPLVLGGSGGLEPGDRVVVLGNPLGLTGTISDGIVAAVRPEGLGSGSGLFQDTPLIQVTAPISPGSSGSPVLSGRGEVVGVAVGQYVFGQNLNFAIPAESVLALLAAADLESFERRLGSDLPRGRWPILRNVGISIAFFAAIWLAFRLLRD